MACFYGVQAKSEKKITRVVTQYLTIEHYSQYKINFFSG